MEVFRFTGRAIIGLFSGSKDPYISNGAGGLSAKAEKRLSRSLGSKTINIDQKGTRELSVIHVGGRFRSSHQ